MAKGWSKLQVWLGTNLKLTVGGRAVFTALLALGVLAGATGTGFAFYNVESSHDPEQVLGLQIAFSWIVAGIIDAVLLSLVTGFDSAFRAVRRFANPS